MARSIFLAWATTLLVLVGSCSCSGCSSGGGGGSPGGGSTTLSIAPRTGSVFLGTLGGPFDPASYSYTLQNTGTAGIDWTVSASEAWVVLGGSTGGTLLPQESISVTVSLDDTLASSLALGVHTASVRFRMPANPWFEVDRAVILDVVEISDGWTDFTPSVDTRIVYVSESIGKDTYDGLSEALPKRSIAEGISLLRHGYPDWLLLRKGDVWHESLQHWKKSGRSLSERMLVSTWGPDAPRPLLMTGENVGIFTGGGGGAPPSLDHLAIVGLHFVADGYTGVGNVVGAEILQPGANLLIEDCKFERYSTNLVFQGTGGRLRNLQLRRSVIVDAYNIHGTGNHPAGLYADGFDGLLIEENVFDHNGWNEAIAGAGADVFSHNVYINNDSSGAIVRGNIFAEGASHGVQLRSGGEVVDNLFVRNSIALLVGGGNTPNPGGVTAAVHGNVILDGKDIDASNPRGWGIVLSNIASAQLTFNLIANNTRGSQPVAITLAGLDRADSPPGIGIHDLEIHDSIVSNWGGSIVLQGDERRLTNITLERTDVQDLVGSEPLLDHEDAASLASLRSSENRFFSLSAPIEGWVKIAGNTTSLDSWLQQVGDSTSTNLPATYTESARSLDSYSLLLGGAGTHEDFMREARGQSRGTWRPELTAAAANTYFRGGFDLVFH